MNYRISDEELDCMLREVRNTSPSASTFTLSLSQARSLIEETHKNRQFVGSGPSIKHIDLYDLSTGTMAVWGGDDTD